MTLIYHGTTGGTIRYCKLAENDAGLRLLVSYFNLKTQHCLNKFPLLSNWIVDSGAFSAWAYGSKITLEEYCSWLERRRPEQYVCLDVIRNGPASKKNWEEMRSRRLDKAIPVFHREEPFEILEHYAKNSDYIGIGGIASRLDLPVIISFLDKCFDLLKRKYWPIKVHGFAVTTSEIMLRYPFYSVDSTASAMAHRIGARHKFDPVSLTVPNKNAKIRVGQSLPRISYCQRFLNSINEFSKLEKTVTDIWTMRGIEWPQACR